MTRSTHLVGSWTSRSPAMAMDNALARLAPHLQRHGETGYLRSKWVQPTLEALRANPEGLVVGEVDVAAACGLARRENITQVWNAIDQAVELINPPSPASA